MVDLKEDDVYITPNESKSLESFDNVPLKESNLTIGELKQEIQTWVRDVLKSYLDGPSKSKKQKSKTYWDSQCHIAMDIISKNGYLTYNIVASHRTLGLEFHQSVQVLRLFKKLRQRNPELELFQLTEPNGIWVCCFDDEKQKVKKMLLNKKARKNKPRRGSLW